MSRRCRVASHFFNPFRIVLTKSGRYSAVISACEKRGQWQVAILLIEVQAGSRIMLVDIASIRAS